MHWDDTLWVQKEFRLELRHRSNERKGNKEYLDFSNLGL